MSQFLLDTNICIYFLKGKFGLGDKIRQAGLDNCFISEITVAELKFGAENSERAEKNRVVIEGFLQGIGILPIYGALDIYATEKARLRKLGTPIDEFDLLIGATAVANSLIMVTNNESHFNRILGIQIENWAKD